MKTLYYINGYSQGDFVVCIDDENGATMWDVYCDDFVEDSEAIKTARVENDKETEIKHAKNILENTDYDYGLYNDLFVDHVKDIDDVIDQEFGYYYDGTPLARVVTHITID